MSTPEEIKFNPEVQRQFDRDFPPAVIDAFEQDASFGDWVDPFVVLAAFDLPRFKPEGKDIVIEHFLSHRYWPLVMNTTTEAGLKVYRRNITPFLMASQEVVVDCMDYWEKEHEEGLSLLPNNKNPR